MRVQRVETLPFLDNGDDAISNRGLGLDLGGEIEGEEDEIAMSRMWRGEIPDVPPAADPAGESEVTAGQQDASDEEPADEPRQPKGMSRRQLLAKFRPSLENGTKEGTSAK